MPSFRVASRWVHDTTLPIAVRHVAFCWAIESYSWLTGQGWQATYTRLGAHLGFDWERKPSGQQMTVALHVLELERERVKMRLDLYRSLRRQEKRQGRRQVRPNATAWVYEPTFLEVPHRDGSV